MIDTVIFDLDGTLLNTLEDLKNSTNFALNEFGFPKRSLKEVRCFVGNGVRKLIERAVPKDCDKNTRKIRIFSCLNINLRITNVDTIFSTQLFYCFKNPVRSRFFRNVIRLPFSPRRALLR